MLFVSELDADARVVWSHAARMDAELASWVRMSVSRGLGIDAAPTERRHAPLRAIFRPS